MILHKLSMYFCTFFLFLISASGCFAEPPLLLSTFTGPPLSNADHSGMYDLVLKEAFKRAGRQINIIQLPAERSLLNADQGITDGDFVRIAGLTQTYPDLIMVPEKLTDFEFVAFTKHVNLKTTGWETLRPYNVAIVRGWKILEKNITGTRSLIKVKDEDMLFTLLDNDRTDLVVYGKIGGYGVIRKLGLKGITALDPPLEEQEMFLYLNKKHEELVPLVDAALKQMKSDGTYDNIAGKTLMPYLPK